jgi:hydroxyacid-oxoacid transhydrogenase
MDFANMKARTVGVYTDSIVGKLLPMQQARESLDANGINYVVFDRCRVEPNQESWQDGIQFAKEHDVSHFLAVGGGVNIPPAFLGRRLTGCTVRHRHGKGRQPVQLLP